MGKSSRGGEPSEWVRRFAPLVRPGGRVLDVACGAGRHALFFAERGHPVVAVDRDEEAIAALSAVPGVTALRADLEAGPWPCGGDTFAGVVVTRYLHRPLVPHIVRALEPGGVLLYETFMAGHERLRKPSNPDFLLRPGELLELVRGLLDVIAFEQGAADEPAGAVVQRLCATKGGPLRLPGAVA